MISCEHGLSLILSFLIDVFIGFWGVGVICTRDHTIKLRRDVVVTSQAGLLLFKDVTDKTHHLNGNLILIKMPERWTVLQISWVSEYNH